MRAALLVPLAVALVLHSLVFDFVCDDAFISFVYSRNLAQHGQLVFNLGERVEGYTNFLWTVLLAGFLKIGLSAEVMSRVLGAGFAIGTLAVVVRMARKIGGDSPWNVVAPLLLAGCGGYACWSSGGLETALFTFLVTLGFARHLEGRRGAAVAFALAAMTRPEGNLFFALAMLHRLLVSRGRRIDLATIGIYLGLYVPYFAWRWHYYGWPFPNTFYIKSSGGHGTFGRGVFYLGQFFKDYGVWFIVPLVVPPAARTWRVWTLAVMVVVGFGLYVASV